MVGGRPLRHLFVAVATWHRYLSPPHVSHYRMSLTSACLQLPPSGCICDEGGKLHGAVLIFPLVGEALEVGSDSCVVSTIAEGLVGCSVLLIDCHKVPFDTAPIASVGKRVRGTFSIASEVLEGL